MPTAEKYDQEIVVTASYREKAMMQSIPGTRFKEDVWRMPLSWASCQSLRGSFPETLEIGDRLASWAFDKIPRVDELKELRNADGNEYPFAYQDIAVKYLEKNNVLLADEMGLGKSKEVIDTISKKVLPQRCEVLIICPNTLKYVWKAEWEKWAPDFPVFVIDGALPKKKKILEERFGVFIVNYESLKSLSRVSGYGSIHLTDQEKESGPLNREWDTIVLDEAHRIKDHKAKQTRAAWAIGQTARQRLALTGTPIANSPVDLWSIMHFIEPNDWPSRTKYIDRYCLTSYNFFGGLEVIGLKPQNQKEFFNILDPHFLRRTKAEVLKSLPEKTYQVRYVDMTAKQAKAYKDMKNTMIAELDSGILYTTSPLVKVSRLAQIASAMPLMENDHLDGFEMPSCKVDAVLEILDEAPGDQLVVFAVNVGIVTLLVESLVKAGITAVRVTGEESAENRADAVSAFQASEAQVIVLTTATGSEGITLTAASRCVFVQHPWSHIQYTQAQDRLHRPGQTQNVQIIDLVARNTVEELVLETLSDKEVSMQELCRDPQWLKRVLT